MKPVKSFDVFKHMADSGDNELKLVPMSGVVEMQYHHKRGTKVTFGVPGNVVFQIENGELVGGFLFCDKKHFEQVRQELEARTTEEAARVTEEQG